jgi:hypothetical protein
MAKDPTKGLATTVKYTISPQASPTGTKVLQILVSAPRTRKGIKPPVKPAKIPPPPSAEKGETVKPRAGASLARVCTDGKPVRYVAGRVAEIVAMGGSNPLQCYGIGDILRRDAARTAEAKARGLDPRGFVPSWDAPRSSEASENPPKISFATAENTAIMDAHNARVQPLVDRIDAHNALVAVKYGTGIEYPCHNNARKVRRRCRTFGACAARRTLHHVCPSGCVSVDTPTGTVGALWRNRPMGRTPEVYEGPSDGGVLCRAPHGYAHGTVLHKLCQIAPVRPLWALTGHACGNVARKARAKFQKETARNFRGK